MAALPPRPARRRPRLGSLERPVSGRLYRGTWLLVGMPLLIAAFSVNKAIPLPAPQPNLPSSFDRPGTLALATDLSGTREIDERHRLDWCDRDPRNAPECCAHAADHRRTRPMPSKCRPLDTL